MGDSSASCRQFVVLLLGAQVIRGAMLRQGLDACGTGHRDKRHPRGLWEKGGRCIQHWRR